MKVVMAKNFGFCFGVKRAIKIAQDHKNSVTFGPLIHNAKENKRLKDEYGIDIEEDINLLDKNRKLVIRTHGIEKQNLKLLEAKNFEVIDATCPFVRKPQVIAKEMSEQKYQIIIFGDINHPEVKGIMSYADDVHVVSSLEELAKIKLSKKVALISQTTKQPEIFVLFAQYISTKVSEVRIFNTICNATLNNQDAANELSKNVDIMIVIGGKNSSNTKQLLNISKINCASSYLIEDESELDTSWFISKNVCGITAGASTPDWIIERVKSKIESL